MPVHTIPARPRISLSEPAGNSSSKKGDEGEDQGEGAECKGCDRQSSAASSGPGIRALSGYVSLGHRSIKKERARRRWG
eukprot:643114-Rhodomonas_salina.3